jgi:hypothetical protein
MCEEVLSPYTIASFHSAELSSDFSEKLCFYLMQD